MLVLSEVFVSVPDPRSKRQARHDLSELLTVAVCAVLCAIALGVRSCNRISLKPECTMPVRVCKT